MADPAGTENLRAVANALATNPIPNIFCGVEFDPIQEKSRIQLRIGDIQLTFSPDAADMAAQLLQKMSKILRGQL